MSLPVAALASVFLTSWGTPLFLPAGVREERKALGPGGWYTPRPSAGREPTAGQKTRNPLGDSRALFALYPGRGSAALTAEVRHGDAEAQRGGGLQRRPADRGAGGPPPVRPAVLRRRRR